MTKNTVSPQPAASPISRKYLHDEVARRLRVLIQSGELKPQQRLNEGELAVRFSISRTPLREAIKILATEGLLDLLPNRGARVASISEAEIDEMLEVIAGLEATGGELSCSRITPQEFASISELHTRMTDAYARHDHLEYFELNRSIHEAIIGASHNTKLQDIYLKLSGRVQRARFAAHTTTEQWQSAMDDHNRMIELLRARKGSELALLLRDHVLNKKAAITGTFGRVQDVNEKPADV